MQSTAPTHGHNFGYGVCRSDVTQRCGFAGSRRKAVCTKGQITSLNWLWENLVIRLVRVEKTARSNRASQTKKLLK